MTELELQTIAIAWINLHLAQTLDFLSRISLLEMKEATRIS